MKTKFKNDSFKRSRGGKSKLLSLNCEKCERFLFNYQKDGPGTLKRLYIDRIQDSVEITKNFVCKNCQTLLGVYIIYEKESRPAYRLFPGSVKKSIASTS